MDNFKLTKTREGHLHINGLPTGVWLERLDSHSWHLNPVLKPLPQYAIFRKRRDAFQAAIVFIEGITQEENETPRNAAIRALWSCAATGSSTIVKTKG